MPKMGYVGRAISMTRSDTWTTTEVQCKSDAIANFCINQCPHKDTPCKGDCPEMKEFRKNHKGRINNG